MEAESHEHNQELRSKAAVLWTRIDELKDEIARSISELARAERLWIAFDKWPSDLKRQHERDVAHLSMGNFVIDEDKLAPIAYSANSSLLEGRTHEQFLEVWRLRSMDISRRIAMVLESPIDQGHQEMLQAELGIVPDYSSGVRFVEGFFELLEELKSLFLKELAHQSEMALDSLAIREELWDADNWSGHTVSRFEELVAPQRTELNELQSQLMQIPIDLRYPDHWYRHETLANICCRTGGCETFHDAVDVRTLSSDEIWRLIDFAPRFRGYVAEKYSGLA